MNELGSVERRIVKRDAKIVVTENALAFFVVSLPVTVLGLLFALRSVFSMPEWAKWLAIGLAGLFLYLPLTIGQAAYLLGEIRQKPCKKTVVFQWFTSPRLYGRAVVFGLISLGLYAVYAGACYLLYLLVSFGAAQFARFIENPGAEEYLQSAFLLLAMLGASILELFLSPAKNYLAGGEGISAAQAVRKSFDTARAHGKPLLLLRVTWIGWIAGVYFLDGAAGGNWINAVTQTSWWIGALYGAAALLFYLISFYVGIYMDTANLSFNELCIARSRISG